MEETKPGSAENSHVEQPDNVSARGEGPVRSKQASSGGKRNEEGRKPGNLPTKKTPDMDRGNRREEVRGEKVDARKERDDARLKDDDAGLKNDKNIDMSRKGRDLFNIMYTNCRSVVNKMDELKASTFDIKPDMILLCETWTNDSISDAFLQIDGYSLEVRLDRSDTTGGKGGGLLCYAKNGQKIAAFRSNDMDAFNQCCGVRIPWSNAKGELSLVLAYRPPRSPGEDAGNTSKLCNVIKSLEGESLVIGDINLPGISWDVLHSDAAGREFLDTVQDKFMVQHVDFPTHDSGSIIDLVLSTNADLVSSVKPVGKLGSSDHVIFVAEVCGPIKEDCTTEMVPDWAKADFEKLHDVLLGVDWEEQMGVRDTLESWDLFEEILNSATEECVPKKRRRTRNKPIWMTKNVMRIIRKKRRLWNSYRGTKDHAEFMAYKKVEDEVKKAVRNAKKAFEKKLVKDFKKNKKNTKPFYSYLKGKTSNRVSVGPLRKIDEEEKEVTVTDDEEMCNVLNDFFSSVFTAEDLSNLPKPRDVATADTEPLATVSFTEKNVQEKLKKLNPTSAPGPDRQWPRILNKLADVLCIPLAVSYTHLTLPTKRIV